ncbi:ABC transporter ATP-binding protein [Cumulibacter manganitolerans]|uniref:ABC transporter ATP-binding protein n=1 Tax=Cumulibacter manganitolerans TaxID=1884992 RepID=UPI001294E50F|nr:ABC transporter ATP-binding protein [Cumulibacter manganitolerans]
MVDLQVDRLGVAYGRVSVLDGITLSVPSGTTTAILGPSGCGKTTLLRAIAGFLRPTTGTVRLGDRIVCGPRDWVRPEHRQVGYVSQDGNLFPHLSVADNITFGMPWRQRRARSRVGELLELVGLDETVASRSPDQLSGGQQQRVSLARALAIDPRLVLLDEPFSSLDVALRASTREAVAAALRAADATVVLVTHDQSEALSFADQVAVMRGGRFAHVGDPVELYQRPADLETATFVGDAVVLPGDVRGSRVECVLGELPQVGASADGPADVLVRPEQLAVSALLTASAAGERPAPGEIGGVVAGSTFHGPDAVLDIRLDTGGTVRAKVPAHRLVPRGGAVRLTVEGPVLAFSRKGDPATSGP